VPNAIAEDKDAVVAACASKFTQETYVDASTGLSVTYNMLLPKDYDQSRSYPMVVFIADSSCTGNDASRSLTQGLGALVWATDEWQAANPTIVCVPTYPETILDDHSGYTTTEYVELTKRLIDSVTSSYAVDASRIYGTGQSMGCMTTLILASEYPDLYAGCMLVDGQWDVSTLKGLEGQRFVYFAAEDDTSAFAGMSEVEAMFEADSVPFASAQWDGGWTPDERSSAATELFSQGKDANFISWKTGTIDAGSGSFGSQGGGLAGEGGAPEGGFGGPSGEGRSGGVGGAGAAGGAGGMGGASYHMASFNYAYRCIAVMEWLFQQA
jgi:poly(3-hydroxybutyrate) depolymerase